MKSVRIFWVVFGLVLGMNYVYSQPILEWAARFNGLLDSTDISRDIVVDNAGNTYVTGSSYKLLGLLTDAVTISYDASGNQRWRSEYNTLLNDAGVAIVLDNTQQYVYVAGYTGDLLGLAVSDYVIIKYRASDGVQIWAKTYNFGVLGDDKATDIAVDSQNNPIITGYSQGFLLILTPYDYATVKYDQNGNQLWANRYNGPAGKDDRAYAITVDGSDNIIITGSSEKNNGLLNYDNDYATVKYNSAGTQQWVQRYNGPGNNEDRAYAITVDGADNVIVTGESMGSSSNYDYATVKYNPAGSQQWASRYNGTGNNYDRAYAITVDGADNVIVTGDSRSTSAPGSEDYATVKYNPAGSQQWASRYNGTGNGYDRAYAITVDGADNVYVTGESAGTTSGQDYSTVQYNPSGSQQWAVRYNGTGNNQDRAYAITVDGADNVYVTGESRNGSLVGSEDYLTAKYSNQSNPLSIISSEVPVKTSISQNYPNPFNPKTHINFDIASQSQVKITVYDLLGNKISEILNSRLNPGKYSVEWNAENFPSGIYFYRINAENFVETKKLILAK